MKIKSHISKLIFYVGQLSKKKFSIILTEWILHCSVVMNIHANVTSTWSGSESSLWSQTLQSPMWRNQQDYSKMTAIVTTWGNANIRHLRNVIMRLFSCWVHVETPDSEIFVHGYFNTYKDRSTYLSTQWTCDTISEKMKLKTKQTA